ncbi:hypothetical protein F5Y16DRAFT_368047 [Xylariaceae sp. FL0255]|nr:hypothetical protein F5Y16DRAFT_368047 [Xylariaceae sp. FL0255]
MSSILAENVKSSCRLRLASLKRMSPYYHYSHIVSTQTRRYTIRSGPMWREIRLPLAGSRLLSSTTSPNKKPSSEAPRPTGSPNKGEPTPDDFKIDFRDLGMNRTTKIVVYTAITIIGTMETIFWCKAAWRWWKGEEDGNETKETST